MIKTCIYKKSKISYRISGNGPFVMLLHGFAEDSSIWKNVLPALEENHTIILPDLPGSGKSDLLPWSASIDDYADCMHEIFTSEKIEKAIFIGHSMGGYISLAFAEKYSDKLLGLGLFHSSAFADDEEKIASRRKAIKVINEKGSLTFLKTAIPGLFNNKEKSKDDIDILIEKGRHFSADALIQHYEAMIARPGRTAVLKNLKIPLLLILGRYDQAIPLAQGLLQTHIADITYVHIMKESAHMSMLEEKILATDILIKFLQSVPA